MRKVCRSDPEPKYSLEEIAHNRELFKKIIERSQTEKGEPQPVESLTQENLLPRERVLGGSDRKNPLNRKEKHNREVQALLLMDEVLGQTERFTAREKIVDFAKAR